MITFKRVLLLIILMGCCSWETAYPGGDATKRAHNILLESQALLVAVAAFEECLVDKSLGCGKEVREEIASRFNSLKERLPREYGPALNEMAESSRKQVDLLVEELTAKAAGSSVQLSPEAMKELAFAEGTTDILQGIQRLIYEDFEKQVRETYPTKEKLVSAMKKETGFTFNDRMGAWTYEDLVPFYYMFQHLPVQFRANHKTKLFGSASYRDIFTVKIPSPPPGVSMENSKTGERLFLTPHYDAAYTINSGIGLFGPNFLALPVEYIVMVDDGSDKRHVTSEKTFFGFETANTLLHEMAHAIDDELKPGNMDYYTDGGEWRNLAWRYDKKGKTWVPKEGSVFYTTYAKKDPSEHFAMSMEGFFLDPFFPCYATGQYNVLSKKLHISSYYPSVDCSSPLARLVSRIRQRDSVDRWVEFDERKASADRIMEEEGQTLAEVSSGNDRTKEREVEEKKTQLEEAAKAIRDIESFNKGYDQLTTRCYYDYLHYKYPLLVGKK